MNTGRTSCPEQVSTLKVFFAFGVKKIGLKYFHHLQMIEYCRLNIDYLRNAFIKKKIIKMTERADSAIVAYGYDGRKRHPQIFNIQYSIVNSGLSGLGAKKTDESDCTWNRPAGQSCDS